MFLRHFGWHSFSCETSHAHIRKQCDRPCIQFDIYIVQHIIYLFSFVWRAKGAVLDERYACVNMLNQVKRKTKQKIMKENDERKQK